MGEFLKKFSCEISFFKTMDTLCYNYKDSKGKWHYGMKANPSSNEISKYHLLPESYSGINFNDTRNIESVTLSNELSNKKFTSFSSNFGESEYFKRSLSNMVGNEENKETKIQNIYDEIKSKIYSNYGVAEKDVTGLNRIVLVFGTSSTLFPYFSFKGKRCNLSNHFGSIFNTYERNITSLDEFNWLEVQYQTINGMNRFVIYPHKDISIFGPLNSESEIAEYKKYYTAEYKNQILNFRTGLNYTIDEYGFGKYEDEVYARIQNSKYISSYDFFKTYTLKFSFIVNITIPDSAKTKNRSVYLAIADKRFGKQYSVKCSTNEQPVTFRTLFKEFKEKYPEIAEYPEIPSLITKNFTNFSTYNGHSNDINDSLFFNNNKIQTEENMLKYLNNPQPFLVYDEETGELENNKNCTDSEFVLFNSSLTLYFSENTIKDYDDFKTQNRFVFHKFEKPTFRLLDEEDKEWYSTPYSGYPIFTKDENGVLRKLSPVMSYDDPNNKYTPGVDYYWAEYPFHNLYNNDTRTRINFINEKEDDYLDFYFNSINYDDFLGTIKTNCPKSDYCVFKDIDENKLYSAIGMCVSEVSQREPEYGIVTPEYIEDNGNFTFYKFSDLITNKNAVDDLIRTGGGKIVYKEMKRKFSYEKHLKVQLKSLFYNFQDNNGKWHYGMKANPSSNEIQKHHFIEDPFENFYEKDYIKSISLANGYSDDEKNNDFINWWNTTKDKTISEKNNGSKCGYSDLNNNIIFTTSEEGNGIDEIAIIPKYQISNSSHRQFTNYQNDDGITMFNNEGYLTLKLIKSENSPTGKAGFYVNVVPYKEIKKNGKEKNINDIYPLNNAFILKIDPENDLNSIGFNSEAELEEYKTRVFDSTNIDMEETNSGEYVSYNNSWFYFNFIINFEIYGPAEKECNDYGDLSSRIITLHSTDGDIEKASIDITNGPVKLKDLFNELKEKNPNIINYERFTYLNYNDDFSEDSYILKDSSSTSIPILKKDIEEQTIFDKDLDIYWNEDYSEREGMQQEVSIHFARTVYSNPNIGLTYNIKKLNENNNPLITEIDINEIIEHFQNKFELAKTDETVKNELIEELGFDYTNFIEYDGENEFKTTFEFAGISVCDFDNDTNERIPGPQDYELINTRTPNVYKFTGINTKNGKEYGIKGKKFSFNWIEHKEWLIKRSFNVHSNQFFKNYSDDEGYKFGYTKSLLKKNFSLYSDSIINGDTASFNLKFRLEKNSEDCDELDLNKIIDLSHFNDKLDSELFKTYKFKLKNPNDPNRWSPSFIIAPENEDFNFIDFAHKIFETQEELDKYFEKQYIYNEENVALSNFDLCTKINNSYFTLTFWTLLKFNEYPAKFLVSTPNGNMYTYDTLSYMEGYKRAIKTTIMEFVNDVHYYNIYKPIDNKSDFATFHPTLNRNLIEKNIKENEDLKKTVLSDYIIDWIPYDKTNTKMLFKGYMGLEWDDEAGAFKDCDYIKNFISGDETIYVLTDVEKPTKTLLCNLNLDFIENIPEAIIVDNGSTIEDAFSKLSSLFTTNHTLGDKLYKLKGFSTSPDGEIIDNSTPITDDLTLYAIWDEIDREFIIKPIHVLKNDGTDDYENIEYKIYLDEDFSSPDPDIVLQSLSESMLQREPDIDIRYDLHYISFDEDIENDGYIARIQWEEIERHYTITSIKVYKTDNSDKYETVDYRNYEDTPETNFTFGGFDGNNLIPYLSESFKTRERDEKNYYTFAGIKILWFKSDGSGDDTKPLYKVYCLWDATPRPSHKIEICIHKNNGKDIEKQSIEYLDFDDDPDDTLTVIYTINMISTKMFNREKDDNYYYTFKGLSFSPDGDVLNENLQITSDTDLYMIWNKHERVKIPVNIKFFDNYSENVYEYNSEVYRDDETCLSEIYGTVPSEFTFRERDSENTYEFEGFSDNPNGKIWIGETPLQSLIYDETETLNLEFYSMWIATPREYREAKIHVLKNDGTDDFEDIIYKIYLDEDFSSPDPDIIIQLLSEAFKQREPDPDARFLIETINVEENVETGEYTATIEWYTTKRVLNTFTVSVYRNDGVDIEGNPIESVETIDFEEYEDDDSDDVTVNKIINELSKEFVKKEKDAEFSYELLGLYKKDDETLEILNLDTVISENTDLCIAWKSTPRPKINFNFTIHKNCNDDTEPFLFNGELYADVDDISLTVEDVISSLPEEFKTREKDSENSYLFKGLSLSSEGKMLENIENLITDTESNIENEFYIFWVSITRQYTIETIRVFKEENSEEYEDVSYRNYEDEESDNAPTSAQLESLLSPEFKIKESDINNYAFDGVVIEAKDDGTYKAYCTWSAFPRPYKTINVTINKNDGSNTEPFIYTFKDVTDTDIDDTTVGDVITAIPEEFKTRERNSNNFFTFIGLSDSIESSTPLPEDQKILDDVQLFALWEMSDRPFKIIHVTVHKNDGTDYTKVFNYKDILDKEDDIYTIENVLAEIEDDLKKRDNDDTYSYIFAGISDSPDGEVIDTLTQITDDIDLYLKWTSKERPFKTFTVTVHKNNGSQVTSVLEFKDMTDTTEDNITIRKIIDRLPDQFKTREQSDEFNYTFAGLSDVATGICLSEASVIANDCNLYVVWNVEDRLFNPIKVVVYKNDNTSSAITLNYKDIIDMDKDDLYLNTVLNDLPYDFKERSRTSTHSYEFAGIAETPDGEILNPDKFAIPADKNFYLKWTEHVREFNEIKITIHKNDGTEETRELDFKDMLDDDFDDVYLSLINDRLSDEFKNRPSDSEWIYEFGALSLTADGEAITNFENRFTDNMELYIVWNKTDINLVRDIVEYKKVIKIRPHDILRKFQNTEGKWCYGVVTIQQFNTVDQFDYLDDENIVNINLKTTPDGNMSKIINFSQTLSHLPAYLKPEMFSTVQVKAKIYDNGEKTFEILIPENINIFENGFETEEELDAAIAEAGVAENNTPMYSLFYVNVERTKGEHPETLKVSLHKNDGSSIIEDIDADVSNGPITIKSIIDSFLEKYPDFTKRDSTDLFSYKFNNYALDINNSKPLTDFELENRMVYANPLILYCIWNEYERTYSDINLLVHKNDGSAEYEKISFRELDDTDIDDVDYIMVQDRLSESLKTRNHDDIYLYHFVGISETPNGEVINSTEYKFKESKNLYIIWEKEKLIPEDPEETPDNKDEFVKAGDLKLIEDTLFIIPEDIGNIKNIEYCNDYYYVLCDNNKVYKISVQDDVAKIENILDLSGYNSDSSDTDIFACENVLIIKAGDYILTDKETIKSNFGISENSLSFKIDDTIKTLNTKTIAIINSK